MKIECKEITEIKKHIECKIREYCCDDMKEAIEASRSNAYPCFQLNDGKITVPLLYSEVSAFDDKIISFCPFCGERVNE